MMTKMTKAIMMKTVTIQTNQKMRRLWVLKLGDSGSRLMK